MPVDSTNTTSNAFLAILDAFALRQFVDMPTHNLGHTLDLFIGRVESGCSITNTSPTFISFSDHMAIACDIGIPINARPAQISKTIRLFKNFEPTSFVTELLHSGINFVSGVDLDLFVNAFSTTVRSLLDKHAPSKTVKYSLKNNQPFYTRELREQKRLKSRLESVWRRNKTLINFTHYKEQVRNFAVLLRDAKRNYYKSLVDKYSDNSKKLWSILCNIVGNNNVKVLPTSVSEVSLAKAFQDFFIGKVKRLSATLADISNSDEDTSEQNYLKPPTLNFFGETTEEEVRQIILNMSDATCKLDDIPTKNLKQCLDGFVKLITTMINKCFVDGKFPSRYKQAIVVSLLKKANLPKEELSSYRPVSHLNFISKVIEKVIQKRILFHINSFSGFPVCQSAYRMFHSTETALLKLQNDLLLAMENKKVSALALLDLSAAFDMVDHATLIDRLQNVFGFSGMALSLVRSYLTNRTQSVQIGDYVSPPVSLETGVPQGSILGPLLFSLYTAPLEQLLLSEGLKFHFYADDTQIYMSFSASEIRQSLQKLTDVLDKVKKWFLTNRLSLNAEKTDFIIFGNWQQRNKLEDHDTKLSFEGCSIKPCDSVKNLGVLLDKGLSFSNHVSKVCQISFLHIRNFRRIRGSLDFNSAKLLANAVVSSRLDYCNSLLYGINAGLVKKLQRVQNALARVVVPGVRRFDYIAPTLKQLHWLPVKQRLLFKMALLTFKVLKTSQPQYLADLLSPKRDTKYGLRSVSKGLLEKPTLKSEKGRRSFSYAAPTLWNSLPQEVRECSTEITFRKKLKTYLFPR